MPEVEIVIGGKSFDVACQEGEEHYLRAAAKMLDEEASVLSAQIGQIPEARMLLMAGLMLADKTAGVQDKLREMEGQMTTLADYFADQSDEVVSLLGALLRLDSHSRVSAADALVRITLYMPCGCRVLKPWGDG